MTPESDSKPQAEIEALRAEVGSLRQAVTELQTQVAELRATLPSRANATRSGGVRADDKRSVAPAAGLDVRRSDPLEEPRAVITALLSAALEPVPPDAPTWTAEEETDTPFDRFRACFHADRRGTHVLDTGLLRFAWPRLRRTAASYLREASDASSFVVARSAPAAPGPEHRELRVFLRADGRMPVPVSLRRDEDAGGSWRIDAVSL